MLEEVALLDVPHEIEYREGFPVLTVSQAVEALDEQLRDLFPGLWLRGEISGLTHARSGHYYFTLKDDVAQISCVLFARDAARLRWRPEEGMAVLLFGEPGIYRDRGQLQVIARQLEPEGAGALAVAFEQLCARLRDEGLFDEDRKRRIPRLPKRVGVATSPKGAVIRDILQVSRRRHPGIDIVIAPTRVQGDGAENEIAAAIGRLQHQGIDVLIVARGGGSLEDLWPFNTEPVARAIFSSDVPVVSAVGHETDTTIADLVADLRAPTPSAAAELVFPDRRQLLADVTAGHDRLTRALTQALNQKRERIERLQRLLPHPGRRLEWQRQRLDDLFARCNRAIRTDIERRQQRLNHLVARLDGVDPLRPLARGYTMAECGGQPVTRAADLTPGQTVDLRFADGVAQSRIESVQLEEGAA
ncbi:MAG: exodeoxyribonuclease VII large subunit [Candidatus Dadabacteria bacterium]|nr:MAG: exodeoxyribonuclease VII large subunit [Candidatus Dadabacteria bacterium]